MLLCFWLLGISLCYCRSLLYLIKDLEATFAVMLHYTNKTVLHPHSPCWPMHTWAHACFRLSSTLSHPLCFTLICSWKALLHSAVHCFIGFPKRQQSLRKRWIPCVGEVSDQNICVPCLSLTDEHLFNKPRARHRLIPPVKQAELWGSNMLWHKLSAGRSDMDCKTGSC